MLETTQRTFAVIGAGPKGLALAVKAKVLNEMGIQTDRVVLIERHRVAAHWSGEFGFTNGDLRLGTPPEKDLVFPLETDAGDPDLNEKIRNRLLQFTWVAYLTDRREYSDWVDRGRPAPSHSRWASYLSWVAGRLAPEVSIVMAEVQSVSFSSTDSERRWSLNLKANNENTQTLLAHRLMITGPGRVRADFVDPEDLPNGSYDLESFWAALRSGRFPKDGRIAIIGAGENSAAALVALEKYGTGFKIEVVSPRVFVTTRSENFYENQVYSHPERNQWSETNIQDRIDFIERTDLGVFSVDAMRALNEQTRHRIIPGRATVLRSEGGRLRLETQYRAKTDTHFYDAAIIATGFDPASSVRRMFTAETLATMESEIDAPLTAESLAMRILPDLSVSGLTTALHLPMLSGIMQGPGFANLSCLGRLSDRILGYASPIGEES